MSKFHSETLISLHLSLKSPPHLQKLYRSLIAAFTKITRLNDAVNSSLPDGCETRKELDIAVNNAEVMLHGGIERLV